MKKQAILALLVVAWWAAGSAPAFGVSKEILQMMQQLDQLQQSVQAMQKAMTEQGAVLKTLVEQNNENINNMRAQVDKLSTAMGQNLASSNARFDSMTSQLQALSESLDEAKSRLAKLSDQLAQTQNIIQTLNTSSQTPGAGAPGAATPGGPGTDAKPPTPDPDSLYKSGISAYNGGQYQIAIQAFQDYLKYYGSTDLASNAQFYIGDCYYSEGNYAQAIEAYNTCIERYPKGNKEAAARLKKGYALLSLDQRSAGIRELRALVTRFPDSREADLARQRLKKLGISVAHRRSGAGNGEE